MHVSTAFNNLDQAEMKEEVYPLKVDPVKIMELLDCLDNETLKNVTSQYVTHTHDPYRLGFVIVRRLIYLSLQISRPLPEHVHLHESAGRTLIMERVWHRTFGHCAAIDCNGSFEGARARMGG